MQKEQIVSGALEVLPSLRKQPESPPQATQEKNTQNSQKFPGFQGIII